MKISHIVLSLLIAPVIVRSAEISKMPAGPLTPQMAAGMAARIMNFDGKGYDASRAIGDLAVLRRYGTFDQATKESYGLVIDALQKSALRLVSRAQGLSGTEMTDQEIEIAEKMRLLTDGYVPAAILGRTYHLMLNELQNNPALVYTSRLNRLNAKMRAMTAALLGVSENRLPEDMSPVWAMDTVPLASKLAPADKGTASQSPAPAEVPAVKNASDYETMDLAAMEKLSRGYKAWIGDDGGTTEDMEFLLQNRGKRFRAHGFLITSLVDKAIYKTVEMSFAASREASSTVFLGRKFFISGRNAQKFLPRELTRLARGVDVEFRVTSNPFRLSGSPFDLSTIMPAEPPSKAAKSGIKGIVFMSALGALLWPSMAHAASLGTMAHAVWTAVEWLTAAIFVLSLILAVIQKQWKSFILFWIMQKMIPWLLRRWRRPA